MHTFPIQARLEDELKPLTTVLGEIEKRLAAGDLIPDFGTLATWAVGVADRGGGGTAKGKRGSQAAEIKIHMEGGILTFPLTFSSPPHVCNLSSLVPIPTWHSRQIRGGSLCESQ